MADSYPKQASLFEKWAKAMLAGATVGKPNYGQKMANKGKRLKRPRRRRRRTRIQRMRKKGE